MPERELPRFLRVDSPYPGLRTFEPEESFLFFGRDEHTRELLARLAENRLLAVVGTSGSGKSSLVRAGLVPALHRGFLEGASSRWKVAIMRPGSGPMGNLAAALGGEGLLPGLSRSSFGIIETLRKAEPESGENLLLVVDQFEEIFRFQRDRRTQDGGAEGQLFVASLLEAAAAFSPSVYVVLTMRSEFVGACTQFPGLPEALNRSQYLIPRLTRAQCREAIEKPLAVAGATPAPALVQRLLYDLGDDPDQLPVLQHALDRTFEEWKKDGAAGPILVKHYTDAGGLEGALNLHAEGLLTKDEAGLRWVERVFRCLTTFAGGLAVRNPASLERILAVTCASDLESEAQVRKVIGRFADAANSLLVLSPPGELKAETVIDISHESLIRRWKTLEGWVCDEADSVRWYADAAEDAWRYPAKAQTWRDPKLAYAVAFVGAGWWNAAWAEWVLKDARVPFSRVREFLEKGDAEQAQERADEASQRKRERNWLIAALALAVLFAAATGWGWWSYRQAAEARADLDAKTKSEAEARKKVTDIQARADQNARRQRELEVQIKDSSGRSATETRRLSDALTSVRNQAKLLERQRADAEAKLVADADARRQSQEKMLTNNVLASTLERADGLEKQLKAAEKTIAIQDDRLMAAQAETERLKALKMPSTVQATPEVGQGRPAVSLPTGSMPPNPGDVKASDKDGLRYRWIPSTPASGFQMGCLPDDGQCSSDERPLHRVTIDGGFWLGETEVTQAAYVQQQGDNPSHFHGANLPVESVTWSEAGVYCRRIGGRLPTEAEWEWAARAGVEQARYGDTGRIAWYGIMSALKTHPVGTKEANDWGLLDMLGNVGEWVSDWYGPYSGASQTDPSGPATGRSRVLRGGSWDEALASGMRSSRRYKSVPTDRSSRVGFRCAVPCKAAEPACGMGFE